MHYRHFRVHSKRITTCLLLAAFCCLLIAACAQAQKGHVAPRVRQPLVEQTNFIQIPGPNPIITAGPEGAWDDLVTEAADAYVEEGVYYFYYHATNKRDGHYQIGVATAPHPLGPFTKYGDKPVLEVGPEGSWEGNSVACAMIMRAEDEDDDTYYMWYSGSNEDWKWSIGLATGPSPVGPWTKYEGNPIIEDFGYMGGALRVDGEYRVYVAHPIHTPWAGPGYEQGKTQSREYHSDYSPLTVAISKKPEGPYKKRSLRRPLMVRGGTGDWDDGGISEAEVLYDNGMFHMFYGAVRTFGPRIESVGYAYSFDGFKWFKYGRNPVCVLRANPGAAAFAEIHAIIEQPFIYIYHTLRPIERRGESYPWDEDLGVQVLVTQRPFSLDMPIMQIGKLERGEQTILDDCPPIPLGNISAASLTLEATYDSDEAKEGSGIVAWTFSSPDGLTYDTEPLDKLSLPSKAGASVRKTFELPVNVRFIKVVVGVPEDGGSVSSINVTATLAG